MTLYRINQLTKFDVRGWGTASIPFISPIKNILEVECLTIPITTALFPFAFKVPNEVIFDASGLKITEPAIYGKEFTPVVIACGEKEFKVPE